VGYNITKQQQIDLLVTKYMKTLHRIHEEAIGFNKGNFMKRVPKNKPAFPPPPPPAHLLSDRKKLGELLEKYDLDIADISIGELSKKGRLLAADMDWRLYELEGYNYFYKSHNFEGDLLIKDNLKVMKKTEYIIILAIVFNILFASFYIFLFKKLQPLHFLKRDIKRFSEGSLDIDTSCIGKDEISEVSNEFNNAIKQIKTLTNSRNLFLRNIMHELKTPITKGLLISNMMEDGKYKDSLKKVFFRLEYLLKEFTKIEEFTSKNITLKKSEFRIVDIIDQALDILILDSSQVQLDVEYNTKAVVDFELFSIAVKNLIDNAIKYGKGKPNIVVTKDYLYIRNKGEKLSKPLKEFNKPFNRKYEGIKTGLGLGLYIVNNILNAHDLILEYDFKENENIFSIKI
jgi:two-component system OmpR family sensor kinase